MRSSRTNAVKQGLTLIELVVVMAIIAALAAMVIPRLDFLKTQAEHASSAATTGDLGTIIQTFKASSGKYPTFDTLTASSAVYTKLQAQTVLSALEPWTVTGPGAPGTSDWYRCFSDAGFTFGYSHNASATDASNSGATVVDIVNQIFDSTLTLASIKATGGGTNAGLIRSAIYPGGVSYQVITPAIPDDPATTDVNETAPAVSGWVQTAAGTIPTNKKLVVFGIGPKSNLVGNAMVSAPMGAMGSDDSKNTYCRYLVVFEVSADGAPAKLKMVTDHRLRQIGDRIDLYKGASAIN